MHVGEEGDVRVLKNRSGFGGRKYAKQASHCDVRIDSTVFSTCINFFWLFLEFLSRVLAIFAPNARQIWRETRKRLHEYERD
jgi:hypothetical protein